MNAHPEKSTSDRRWSSHFSSFCKQFETLRGNKVIQLNSKKSYFAVRGGFCAFLRTAISLCKSVTFSLTVLNCWFRSLIWDSKDLQWAENELSPSSSLFFRLVCCFLGACGGPSYIADAEKDKKNNGIIEIKRRDSKLPNNILKN